MSKLQPVRGTKDIFGEDARRHAFVVERFQELARRYRFEPIDPPIFEFTGVFARTLGDASDIVTKEMYSFEDRGGESLTLRPEFTAGIARAFISGGLQQHLPLKLFAHGPAFRYERPQKGRYRQFHQLDAEILGVAEPQADIELIGFAHDLLNELGLKGRVKLHLNTLGDGPSRDVYREALVAYFSAHKDKLSEDSVLRLEKNPLRILDSKDEGDRALVADAPLIIDYLTDEARAFFNSVCEGLTQLGVDYVHDQRLVRGLDYYSHTAFEFITTDLGAQGTVLAGGRYDALIETMGGSPTPGVGWAAGIERLSMLADLPESTDRPIAIIPMGERAEKLALSIAHDLRVAGYSVDHGFKGNMKKRLKRANAAHARLAIIMGDDELDQDQIALRDLDNGEQELVPLSSIVENVTRRFEEA